MNNDAKALQELEKLSDELEAIKKRQDDIEQEYEEFSKEASVTIVELNGLLRGDRKAGTPGLKSIVYGSKALGVKPIRDMMTDFADDLGVVMTTHARWRWLLGILSLTSVAGVIGWILFLREIAGVP